MAEYEGRRDDSAKESELFTTTTSFLPSVRLADALCLTACVPWPTEVGSKPVVTSLNSMCPSHNEAERETLVSNTYAGLRTHKNSTRQTEVQSVSMQALEMRV